MPRPYGDLPGEMEVVDLMVRLREDGMGYQAISHHLNDHEIPTRLGATWWPLTVRDILRRHRPDLCPPRQPLPVPQAHATRRYRDMDRRRIRGRRVLSEAVA